MEAACDSLSILKVPIACALKHVHATSRAAHIYCLVSKAAYRIGVVEVRPSYQATWHDQLGGISL